MMWREKLSKPIPKEFQLKPKNPEAYKAALQWLQENDPLDILDEMPGGMRRKRSTGNFLLSIVTTRRRKIIPAIIPRLDGANAQLSFTDT